MPEVRGAAKPYGGASYPRSGPFPRTSSRHSSLLHCGRADRDEQDCLNSVDAAVHHFSVPFEARGVISLIVRPCRYHRNSLILLAISNDNFTQVNKYSHAYVRIIVRSLKKTLINICSFSFLCVYIYIYIIFLHVYGHLSAINY